MKLGFADLAQAQAQSCSDAAIAAQWEVADAWLGVYAVLDEAAAKSPGMATCKPVHLAEARRGLALSWLELVRAREELAQTAIFRHATDALDVSARALAVRLPPLTADQAAVDAYIRSSVEAAEHASKTSCRESTIASQ